jgi:hypothetical protein
VKTLSTVTLCIMLLIVLLSMSAIIKYTQHKINPSQKTFRMTTLRIQHHVNRIFYCYAKCRCTKCRCAEFCTTECCFAECCYAQCRYAQCRVATKRNKKINFFIQLFSTLIKVIPICKFITITLNRISWLLVSNY